MKALKPSIATLPKQVRAGEVSPETLDKLLVALLNSTEKGFPSVKGRYLTALSNASRSVLVRHFDNPLFVGLIGPIKDQNPRKVYGKILKLSQAG